MKLRLDGRAGGAKYEVVVHAPPHRRFGRPREPYTLDDTMAHLLRVLPPHYRVYAIARRVMRGLFRHHAFDHAATLAFYFFLGTIPLLVLAGMLVSTVVRESGTSSLLEPIYRVVPAVTAEMIRHELHSVANTEIGSFAPVSLAGFLYLTSNGFHNLMDVFEYLAGSPPVSWWRQRLLAIGWVFAAILTMFATLWIVIATNGRGLLWIAGAVMTGWLAAFYRLSVNHPRPVRRRVWPGTFVAMVLFVLVTWGFSAYVRTIGHYAVFYGSIAAIAVTLLWLYLASLAVLTGAEVNAQLEGLRDPPQKPAP